MATVKTEKQQKSSLSKRRIQKFMGNRMAIAGLVVILIMIILCAAAPLLTSWDPRGIDVANKTQLPSREHLLGTDQLGRDIFARLLYGGRMSILIGLVSSVLANGLGVVLGCIAGYFGGKVDAAIMWIGEIFVCFPSMILIMIVMSFLGSNVFWLIFIFVITGWVGNMRMVRSRVLQLKQEPYIDTCRALGVSGFNVMFKHLLPNIFSVVCVSISMSVSGYVLSEAGLSYLGMGVNPSMPTWGNMINAAKSMSIMLNHPHLWLIPGGVLSLFVLACNFFGDGLRDALDVKQ